MPADVLQLGGGGRGRARDRVARIRASSDLHAHPGRVVDGVHRVNGPAYARIPRVEG